MPARRRQAWRERWLDSINELTSIHLQKDTWLDATNRNPHWSFVEFMCSYFDDLLDDHDYKYYIDNEFVTKEEYEAIKLWHDELKRYEPPKGDHYEPIKQF